LGQVEAHDATGGRQPQVAAVGADDAAPAVFHRGAAGVAVQRVEQFVAQRLVGVAHGLAPVRRAHVHEARDAIQPAVAVPRLHDAGQVAQHARILGMQQAQRAVAQHGRAARAAGDQVVAREQRARLAHGAEVVVRQLAVEVVDELAFAGGQPHGAGAGRRRLEDFRRQVERGARQPAAVAPADQACLERRRPQDLAVVQQPDQAVVARLAVRAGRQRDLFHRGAADAPDGALAAEEQCAVRTVVDHTDPRSGHHRRRRVGREAPQGARFEIGGQHAAGPVHAEAVAAAVAGQAAAQEPVAPEAIQAALRRHPDVAFA
ncbi:conserved hypothetical protein, partial [Ricinus communis]